MRQRTFIACLWAMLIGILAVTPAFRLQLPLYTQNVKHFQPLLGALAQQPY